MVDMPSFDVDRRPLYVFKIDDEYLFSEYFDHQDLFEHLAEYYNRDAYRFEVPEDEFETVREKLAEFYYNPEVVENLDEFCVVKEQYTEHAQILRQSVIHWERENHMFFLMKSPLAVDEAVEHGATRITDTEFVVGL